jgi:hypothetical protein
MQKTCFWGLCAALYLGTGVIEAQQSSEVEQLKQQLQQIQESFRRAQAEHQRQIEALMKQLEALQQQQASTAAEQEKLKAQVATAPPTPPEAPAAVTASRPWSPTDPIRIRAGNSFMDIGLLGTFAAGGSTAEDIENGTQLGGHDPNQRGFTVQAVEANFSGAVDNYFRGSANILFQIDTEGESFIEVEEAYLETFTLPGNFQVRGGQYFFDFGRHNPTHTHTWPFVDIPIVNGRFLGPDGLRNPGARLSWLAPTPFYTEFFLTVADSQGETAPSFRFGEDMPGAGTAGAQPFAFRGRDNDRGIQSLGDLLFVPRWVSSFDISDAHTLMVGASGAFGPNSSGQSGDTRTEVYGVDLTWKWKSPRHRAGYPFVTFTTEALLRRYGAGAYDWDLDGDGAISPGEIVDPGTGLPAQLGAETLTDYGFYAQVQYGFTRNWVAGLRFDYVDGDTGAYELLGLQDAEGNPLEPDLLRARRWRVSPNLTWFPTEFSKIRLQYNYDDREFIGVDHSVWLQFEFVLGAHGAHKF